jgi:hypothetical protein
MEKKQIRRETILFCCCDCVVYEEILVNVIAVIRRGLTDSKVDYTDELTT